MHLNQIIDYCLIECFEIELRAKMNRKKIEETTQLFNIISHAQKINNNIQEFSFIFASKIKLSNNFQFDDKINLNHIKLQINSILKLHSRNI